MAWRFLCSVPVLGVDEKPNPADAPETIAAARRRSRQWADFLLYPLHWHPLRLGPRPVRAGGSQFPRQAQVPRREGTHWVTEPNLEPLDRRRGGILEGLLAGLAGSLNTVRIYDWRRARRAVRYRARRRVGSAFTVSPIQSPPTPAHQSNPPPEKAAPGQQRCLAEFPYSPAPPPAPPRTCWPPS